MKWISVKDKLPKLNEFVLATDGKYFWVATRYASDEEEIGKPFLTSYICTCCNMECDFEATHWMPLPEPPEEK